MTEQDSRYAEVVRRDPCSYCASPTSDHADHIVAVVHDSEPGWTNLTGACRRCNHAKSSRELLRFMLAEVSG